MLCFELLDPDILTGNTDLFYFELSLLILKFRKITRKALTTDRSFLPSSYS